MTAQAIGYIRVSTQDQATEGVSLDAQRAKIKAWCSLHDYELTAVYSDPGITGSRMDKRPGLQKALKAATDGRAIVSYSISRLSRSTRDMLSIAEQLQARGADLVSLSENIDTTSAAGRMVFRLLASLAEFERDQISERTKAALAHKKATQQKYAPVPFGYREADGRLVVEKHEAKIVTDILRRRAKGETLAAIADRLNTRGVSGKRGGKWHPSTVSYVVKSRKAFQPRSGSYSLQNGSDL